MLPTPGSRWSHPGSGGVFTVGDVDLRRGVLLFGDAGQPSVRLAPYAWPGPWVLVPGESQDEAQTLKHHPIRTLLLGGGGGRHLLRHQEILRDLGFVMVAHDPGGESRRLAPIPSEVEAIVLIRSHFNHAAYQQAKEQAKLLGLPMALVDSNGMKEALKKERLRLGLGAWESMGALFPGIAW